MLRSSIEEQAQAHWFLPITFQLLKFTFHWPPCFFPAAERADSNTHTEGCQGLRRETPMHMDRIGRARPTNFPKNALVSGGL